MRPLFNKMRRSPDPADAPTGNWTSTPIARLVAGAEKVDPSLRLHSRNVARLSVEIGKTLELAPPELAVLALAAAVHDVGKIGVPREVLMKPGPLEEWERAAIERHPSDGERLLEPHVDSEEVLAIVRSHHERWDGDGYPDGLAAEEIPLGARIVAVADAFTAMVESRPYRKARSTANARAELLEQAGRQFDPTCAWAGAAVAAGSVAAVGGT